MAIDPEGEGVGDLGEYGLGGGDPAIGNTRGQQSVGMMDSGNWSCYIHPQRQVRMT